jgi:hypothetical protein
MSSGILLFEQTYFALIVLITDAKAEQIYSRTTSITALILSIPGIAVSSSRFRAQSPGMAQLTALIVYPQHHVCIGLDPVADMQDGIEGIGTVKQKMPGLTPENRFSKIT